MIFQWTLFLHFVCFSEAITNFTIISPVKKGYEAAFIMIPEDQLFGSSYLPLVQEIQRRSPLSLWCVLYEESVSGSAPEDELNNVFPDIVRKLKSRGMKNNVIFMAGHGTGGVTVAMFLKNNYRMVNGTFLFGTKVPDTSDIPDYLVPTYTISGDMDGIVRFTSLLHMYENPLQYGEYRTPFILIPGVNHAQFSSGDMPDFIKENDFPSTLNDSVARNLIGRVCSDAMTTIIYQPESLLGEANKAMKRYLTDSRSFLKPFVDAKNMDRDYQSVSDWSIQVQTALVGMMSIRHLVDNQVVDKTKLYVNNPAMSYMGSTLDTGSWTSISMTTDKQYGYVSPDQLQTKMVTKTSAEQFLPDQKFNDLLLTCVDFNKMAFQRAVSLAPLNVLTRFPERRKRMYFYEDKIAKSEFEWISSELQTQNTGSDLHLTSTRFVKSGIYDPSSQRNISMMACNLLSPFRALEWLYLDSIR